MLAQRLVRVLCPHCKKATRLSSGQAIRLAKYGVESTRVVYEPVGCERYFNTGYLGRCAIFELLNTTDDLRDVILATSQIQDMRQTVRASLFSSLHDTGYHLVTEGRTSIKEIAA